MPEQQQRVFKMNVKQKSPIISLLSAVMLTYWLCDNIEDVNSMVISALSQVLVQAMGVGILVVILLHVLWSVGSSLFSLSEEKSVTDERDDLIELYSMRVILIIFSLGMVGTLALAGWSELSSNMAVLLIFLSMFVANIVGDGLKIFWYR